jgi:hypothetical protein
MLMQMLRGTISGANGGCTQERLPQYSVLQLLTLHTTTRSTHAIMEPPDHLDPETLHEKAKDTRHLRLKLQRECVYHTAPLIDCSNIQIT